MAYDFICNFHDCEASAIDMHTGNYSHADMDNELNVELLERQKFIKVLFLDHNLFDFLPDQLSNFGNIVFLDVSSTGLKDFGTSLVHLKKLETLIAKNNQLNSTSILSTLQNIESLNLSGNNFDEFPQEILSLKKLKSLYFGGNKLTSIPREIKQLRRLEVLYLGGNYLTTIPPEIGRLRRLNCLSLCDNNITLLPIEMKNLRRLRSLSLHNNYLQTLPPDIVSLNLLELSLRDNPLVNRFVESFDFQVPTLKELAGRTIRNKNISYIDVGLPKQLVTYLNSAHECINPCCRGVYFSTCVEQVKFVDFCGKYRLPLLQYLCSPNCTSSQCSDVKCSDENINNGASASASYNGASSDSEPDEQWQMEARRRMKKILLG